MSRFQFVADHRDAFEVKWLCAIVEIARSSFYAWWAAADGRDARAAADEALAERIRVVHDEDNTYGAPRITAELNDGAPDADRVNHKRVAGVMCGVGIAGYRRKRRVKTTTPDPANQKVPDLLNRDFTAEALNTRYVGDITYLPLGTGANLYLATVIDCCSRRVTGWAIADHMRTELVEDALNAAAALRGSLAGAVFHSDRGNQYTARDFAIMIVDEVRVRLMELPGLIRLDSRIHSGNDATKIEMNSDKPGQAERPDDPFLDELLDENPFRVRDDLHFRPAPPSHRRRTSSRAAVAWRRSPLVARQTRPSPQSSCPG